MSSNNSSGMRALSKLLGMVSPSTGTPFPPHLYGQTRTCINQTRKSKLRRSGIGGQRQ